MLRISRGELKGRNFFSLNNFKFLRIKKRGCKLDWGELQIPKNKKAELQTPLRP